jgi:DNA-binding transcriptional regulator PaaX
MNSQDTNEQGGALLQTESPTRKAYQLSEQAKSLLRSQASRIYTEVLLSHHWPEDLDIVISVSKNDPEAGYLPSVTVAVAP